MATLPATALAAVLVGPDAAAVVAILGWFLLTPLSGILVDVFDLEDGDEDLERARDAWTEWRGDPADDSESRDPLDRLRDRYAAGGIDEAEFERRLDLLLETEDADVETAREREAP